MDATRDEVRRQLDRVLGSDPFVNSDRLSRFLRYVVERTLAGEGDRLKEYVIGTEVFERGEQYDPRVDSIVRVEAGRLRGKLDEYYNRHGAADALVIRMPRGGYTPVFERRPMTAPKPARRLLSAVGAAAALVLFAVAAWGARLWTAADRPSPEVTIVVLPLAHYSTDADDATRLLAARVTDGVTSEIARLGTLGVVSHTSAVQSASTRRSLREVARSLDADFVMEGSIEVDASYVRVMARLVDGSTDRKVWAEEFTETLRNVPELQRRIAAAAATAAVRRGR